MLKTDSDLKDSGQGTSGDSEESEIDSEEY